MPSDEHTIHRNIGEIKKRNQRITIVFQVPNSDDVTLTFESFVTRVDLKQALSTNNAFAALLGVDPTSNSDVDQLFQVLDGDGDDCVSRDEWNRFVENASLDASIAKLSPEQRSELELIFNQVGRL